NGGFFDTADDHEQLVVRPKSLQDNATPSGNAMAIRTLLQLAAYTGDDAYYTPAASALSAMQPLLSRHPAAFAHWLGALEFALAPAQEIALIGPADASAAAAMLAILQQPYRPNQVVALAPAETTTSAVPLLNHRPQQKRQPTAYVCQNFACRLPVTEPEALAQQLESPPAKTQAGP
ncbi:MAG: thioredoxin domain-containing protein, partial [Anaerolineae bacterium]